MPAKNGYARITVDIKKESHRDLKIMAAIVGNSMNKVAAESIERQLNKFKEGRTINKERVVYN